MKSLMLPILMLGAFCQANACQPEQSRRAEARRNAQNLAREKQLASEAAQDSDQIVFGTVKSVEKTTQSQSRVVVEVSEVLKGKSAPVENFLWNTPEYVIISCNPADWFYLFNVVPSSAYLLYVKDGVLLRASDPKRFPFTGTLRFKEEKRIVLSEAGT